MSSLVGDARNRFGLDGPDQLKITVRVCRADDQVVVVTPSCSDAGIDLVKRQLRHVRWRGLPLEAVIEAVFEARLGHPYLLVNGRPDRPDILDELGPLMYELMRELARELAAAATDAEAPVPSR